MFGSILPYDQGLKHNIIVNPQNIYYRDPKDEIMPRKYIIIGKPNVRKDIPLPQNATFFMKPVDAFRIDPKNQVNKKLIFLGKPDTRKINFLDLKNGVSSSDLTSSSEIKTKPNFQIYSKIIRQLYTLMIPDLVQTDRNLLNISYENLQKEFIKNKSRMNDNLLDNLIKNYISSVRPVLESWYNSSDKTINPILTLETGVPLDDILQNNNDDLYQLLIDSNNNKNDNKGINEEDNKVVDANIKLLSDFQKDLDSVDQELEVEIGKEQEKEKEEIKNYKNKPKMPNHFFEKKNEKEIEKVTNEYEQLSSDTLREIKDLEREKKNYILVNFSFISDLMGKYNYYLGIDDYKNYKYYKLSVYIKASLTFIPLYITKTLLIKFFEKY